MSWSPESSFLLLTFRNSPKVWTIKRVLIPESNQYYPYVEIKDAFSEPLHCEVIGLFSPIDMFCIVSEITTKIYTYFGADFRSKSIKNFDCLGSIGREEHVKGLSFSRRGDKLTCIKSNNDIEVWTVNKFQQGHHPTFDLLYTVNDENLSCIENIAWRRDGNYFAVTDDMQSISLFRSSQSGGVYGTRVGDNSGSRDHSIISNRVTCMAWHNKQNSILTSASSTGFLLFWTCSQYNSRKATSFAPKERDVVSEKIYYGRDLKYDAALDLLKDVQGNTLKQLNNVVNDVSTLEEQMGTILHDISSILTRMYRQEEIAEEELKAGLEKVIRLASKVTSW